MTTKVTPTYTSSALIAMFSRLSDVRRKYMINKHVFAPQTVMIWQFSTTRMSLLPSVRSAISCFVICAMS
jgi:hypothetical protein